MTGAGRTGPVDGQSNCPFLAGSSKPGLVRNPRPLHIIQQRWVRTHCLGLEHRDQRVRYIFNRGGSGPELDYPSPVPQVFPGSDSFRSRNSLPLLVKAPGSRRQFSHPKTRPGPLIRRVNSHNLLGPWRSTVRLLLVRCAIHQTPEVASAPQVTANPGTADRFESHCLDEKNDQTHRRGSGSTGS